MSTIPARRGAGDASPRPHRPSLRTAYAAAAVLVVGLVRLPALAGVPQAPDGVGKPLSLREPRAFMEAVEVPARAGRIAVVPGSPVGEAWAIGLSYSPQPGYDRSSESGQVVFLRYTHATGWQVDGPPLDDQGKPAIVQLAALAMAPNGEGWAVGGNGHMVHRLPGGPWRFDPEASSVTFRFFNDVSLGIDERGVYGYAAGENLTILRLEDGRWTYDLQGGQIPTGGPTVPDALSVHAVDRDRAWAVGGGNQLLLLERTRDGWARKLTGDPMFDSPPAPVLSSSSGTVNQFARGTSVSATTDHVWVTGTMRAIDPTQSSGGEASTDPTRPFAVRYRVTSDAFTSFCAPVYQLSSSGVETTIDPCDERFPFAIGELPVVEAFDGGEAVAGGHGFFRFTDAWRSEPNVVGFISSGAFHSPTEGWVSTPGNSLVAGGVFFGSSTTFGHWTTNPSPTRLRRWAQPSTEPLEDIALSPAGTGEAMAVGGAGTILRHEPGVGWDLVRSPTDRALHSISWPAPSSAWAVGAEGTILRFDGREWSADPASGSLTSRSLHGVAFAGPDRGWAVGDKGTILAYAGGTWSVHADSGKRTTVSLADVAVAGSDVIAVGDAATVLVGDGGPFRVEEHLVDVLRVKQAHHPPNLLTVTGLPDGRAFIGGGDSTLLDRAPGEPFRPSRLPPLEGSVHAVALAGDRLVVSLGEKSKRLAGPGLVEAAGRPMVGDAGGWHGLGTNRAAAGSNEIDAPARRDAVLAFALEPDGRRGWAVGGVPPDIPDAEGHIAATPTSSVWRLDIDGLPEPSPAEEPARLGAPPGTVSFAFVGDTACATGLCAAALGGASRGDLVALHAMRQIDAAAREGLVRFVAFGGDMRRNGLPDELEPFAALFDEVAAPVFGALGDKDLFAGPGATAGDQQGGVLASPGYYQRLFASRPEPWGSGPAPGEVEPVRLPGAAPPDDGRSRTHYAFDYRFGGSPVLRVAFVDTSRVPLAASAQNPSEEQSTWLGAVLADARARGIPSIVVMHQPIVVPVSAVPDASTLTTILTANGASATLASHQGLNRIVNTPGDVPGAVPVGIFGSGGSPLDGEWRPELGAYHAWQLITVKIEPGERNELGQVPVRIQSIPVLESVAVGAPDGRDVGAGGVLRFHGLGRLPDAGGSHADGARPSPDQSRATYLRFPVPRTCGPLEDPAAVVCSPRGVAHPHHAFSCEDPQVCAFVREDPEHPGFPLRDQQGRLVADAHGGLLCAFKPGRTSVVLQSGTVAARVPVTVGGGSGPCIPGAVVVADDPFDPIGIPVVAGETIIPPAGTTARDVPTHLLRPKQPEAAAVAAIAPPLVNAAPAPPAGGSGQREEQREAATEQAEMTARRSNEAPSRDDGFAVTLGAAGLASAAAAAVRNRRRHLGAPAYVSARNRRDG